MTLPPIREWWTRLSPEAQQEVLDGDARHLGETAREEIREITGAVVGIRETLGDDDLDYLRAQAEKAERAEKAGQAEKTGDA